LVNSERVSSQSRVVCIRLVAGNVATGYVTDAVLPPSLALRVRLSQRERPTARPPISFSGFLSPARHGTSPSDGGPVETHASHASLPITIGWRWQPKLVILEGKCRFPAATHGVARLE